MDILELIHDLQHEIRQNYKDIARLKYENAVAYKENAIIKSDFSTYKHNLKKAELESNKNG
jgi:regulator of replication initiation timing